MIRSQFRGSCSECGATLKAGRQIWWTRSGGARCVDCADTDPCLRRNQPRAVVPAPAPVEQSRSARIAELTLLLAQEQAETVSQSDADLIALCTSDAVAEAA